MSAERLEKDDVKDGDWVYVNLVKQNKDRVIYVEKLNNGILEVYKRITGNGAPPGMFCRQTHLVLFFYSYFIQFFLFV